VRGYNFLKTYDLGNLKVNAMIKKDNKTQILTITNKAVENYLKTMARNSSWNKLQNQIKDFLLLKFSVEIRSID
jgi:hypothetical protein